MVNGCICVYSGLMELMSDNEIEGVFGYEMGYVVFGYICKVVQIVYVVVVVCGVVGVLKSGVLVVLFGFQLGEFIELLVNVQFFQFQEFDVDDFFYELLKKCGVNIQGLVIVFEKLVKLGGGDSSMFDLYLGFQVCVDYICQCIVVDCK